jgi:hypothetical protein
MIEVMRSQIFGSGGARLLNLHPQDARLDRGNHQRGNLVLQLEDIFEAAVKTVCPAVRPGGSVDELAGDADTLASPAHGTLQDVTDSQLRGGRPDVDGAPFEHESRCARHDEQPVEASERRREILDETIRKMIILWIAAQIVERHDRQRRLVGKGWRPQRSGAGTRCPKVDIDRLGDVLQLWPAAWFERRFDLVRNLFVDPVGYAQSTRFGQLLQPSRDVDAIAEDVLLIGNDLPQMDTEAQQELLVSRLIASQLGQAVLDLHRALGRADNAGELYECAVADEANDSACVALHDWRDHVTA